MIPMQATRSSNIGYKDIQPERAAFKVASISEGKCNLASYNRRDFYKITLITRGSSQLFYANRGINVAGTVLVFTNPLVPYSWEGGSDEPSGYFCVFNDEFLQRDSNRNSLQQSSLFKPGGDPLYLLNNDQVSYIQSVFVRMREEVESDYIFKYDLLRNQLNVLIHEAVKMQPATGYFTPYNAASRITKLFLTLLEKQFPVESPQHSLTLKKAGNFAENLSIHVNHLNAALQEITGKSTTTHINEKIIAEARSLLIHTEWSVAEIAFSLGFEYPSYFNNFFRKHTGCTPTSTRVNRLMHDSIV